MQDLDIIQLLTRPGTYVLGVTTYVLTFFVRRVIETTWPSLRKNADANSPKITYLTRASRWWNEVVLYAIPVLLGVLSGFIKSDFLFSTIGDKGGRFAFGALVGWFCSFLYKCLAKLLKSKTGVDLDPCSDADGARDVEEVR